MRRANVPMGLAVLIVGTLALLNNGGIINITLLKLWPIILIVPGAFLEAVCMVSKRDQWLLVPGAILSSYGIIFFANTLFGWHLMKLLWPCFGLGIALGFLQLGLWGRGYRDSLVPAAVIGTLSLIGLIFTLNKAAYKIMLPLVMVAAGLYILSRNRRY